MSPMIMGVLHEYQSELEKTKVLLGSLKEEHKDWRPHEKSMELGELAKHIVELQTWYNNALKGEEFDLQTDYQAIQYKTFDELSIILSEKVEENMTFIRETKDSFWLESFTFKMGDHIIAKLPKIAFLRSILTNHLIHHRGQMTVYLRLLNIPVPGIYGPSADEK